MVSLSLGLKKTRVRGRERSRHTSMTRLRSRAPRGLRAYGKVPRNRGKNLELIASMSLAEMGEAMCVKGAADAKAFEVYVDHFLAPTLQPGQVVVFDNLGAHRPQRIRELIEAKGAEVVFLPSYSPDLNPIEEALSKIKNIPFARWGHALTRCSPKRWQRRSGLSRLRTQLGGSTIAATRSRFNTCECRCHGSLLSVVESHVLMVAEVLRHDQTLARKPGSRPT